MLKNKISEVSFFTISENGSYQINEDSVSFAVMGINKCFILADGLGGHGGGEIASSIVVNTIKSCFTAFDPLQFEDWFRCAFNEAQIALKKKQSENDKYQDMKTTLSVVVLSEKEVQWAHIGDSRIYMFKKGKFNYRTMDHSVPQMLVLAGEIKDKEIRHHPDRNRLLRVLGGEGDLKIEIGKRMSLNKNDSFLLCSDGFWELIEEVNMEKNLKNASSVEEWVKSMADHVKENGDPTKMDNYSALGIWVR